MPLHKKGRKKLQKEALDKLCFEQGLIAKIDERRRDYVISKDNTYLFRVSLHSQKEYFGVRFGISQSCEYTYTEETVIKLVNKLLEERFNRKITLPSYYSKENHLIND